MVLLGRVACAALVVTAASTCLAAPAADARPSPQTATPATSARTWGADTSARSMAAAVRKPVVRSVGVGSNPIDIAIAQSLGKAFVVNDGSVSVLSLRTHRELIEFGTGGFHGQNAIALVRSNRQGYIANLSTSSIAVFDTRTYRVVKQIPIGMGSTDVVKSNTPKGQRAYVSLLNNQILGISTSRGTVVQRITLPQQAQTLAARRSGKVIWAGGISSGRVYVVNTSTGRVIKTINVDASGPVSSIAFSPDEKTAWVAGLGGITVIKTATGRATKVIPIQNIFGGFPNMGDVALTGSGRYALVENSTFPDAPAAGTVALLDTRTAKVLWRVTTGIEPIVLAIDYARATAYTPNYADDTASWFKIPR